MQNGSKSDPFFYVNNEISLKKNSAAMPAKKQAPGVSFTAVIDQFQNQGEKTGWSYIAVPAACAEQLKPGQKKSFRVRGKLDLFSVKGVALMPMGDGRFILPVNASMRRGTGKRKGDRLAVHLLADDEPAALSKALLECLADEPGALLYFNSLNRSHRLYFSNWIESAKTTATKTARLARAVNALSRKMTFQGMMREHREEK